MEKPRIYLDTSIIGFLEQPLEPLKMATTMGFCRLLTDNSEHYEVVTSALTVSELQRSPDFLRDKLLEHLKRFKPLFLQHNFKVNALHREYLLHQILPENCSDDLLHFAYAVHYLCDTVVSWNFKHFVNEHIIHKLKKVNFRLGCSTPEIISPNTFLERIQDEN